MSRHDGVVLVIADETDTTADLVCAVLAFRDVRIFRFDTAEFPGRLQLRAELDGGTWRGEISRDGDYVDLDEVRSVYVRRPRPFEVPAHLTVAERWHAATECRYGMGGCPYRRMPVVVTVDEHEVVRRLEELAEELTASGDLCSPEWRRAFLAVRRHIFVPRYWHDEEPGAFPAQWRMVDNATRDHQEWLDAVYSNRTLATELTGTPALTGEGMHPQVTSSTTMPGLVMAMLEDLDVADSMRVLEIGTGTGYNAALLCERLGDVNVTSIDVDPELVALADVRLAHHGYDDEHLGTELATPDGSSWAVVHHTPDDIGHPTRQAGPRRLWDELEQLHEQWTALDCPAYHRFGLTLDRNSQPLLWLDHPDSGHTWRRDPASTRSATRA